MVTYRKPGHIRILDLKSSQNPNTISSLVSFDVILIKVKNAQTIFLYGIVIGLTFKLWYRYGFLLTSAGHN